MQTLSPMKIVIVPGWIYRALIRNKLNTIDLLDYKKARHYLSLDDMAEWLYMNDSLRISDCKLSNTIMECLWSNFDAKDQHEVNNSVLHLSVSEEIASSANFKLAQKTNDVSNPVDSNTYQFIRIENILYIVLSEGFMASMLDQENLSIFVKKYLKECYAMTSVAEVSQLGIFNLYLKQFAI